MSRSRRMWPAYASLNDWSAPDSLAVVRGLLKSGLYAPPRARSKDDEDSDASRHDGGLILPAEWQWHEQG